MNAATGDEEALPQPAAQKKLSAVRKRRKQKQAVELELNQRLAEIRKRERARQSREDLRMAGDVNQLQEHERHYLRHPPTFQYDVSAYDPHRSLPYGMRAIHDALHESYIQPVPANEAGASQAASNSETPR